MNIKEQLLIEEYKSCRDLIAKNIDIMEKTEVYAVGAGAAVFAFSASSPVWVVAFGSALIPLVIAGLGYLRFVGLDDTINKINDYLVTLEKKYKTINWTTFYRKANQKKTLKKTRQSFWGVFAAVSFFFALFMAIAAPLSTAKSEVHEAPKSIPPA